MTDTAEQRRLEARLVAARVREEAARVVARGICRAQGCACAERRDCIAVGVYADMAVAAVSLLEEAGWLLVPPDRSSTAPEGHRAGAGPGTGRPFTTSG